MKKKLIMFLIFSVIAIISLNSTLAIRISPDSIRIDFEPNFENSYKFKTQTSDNIGVYFDGELSKYITIEEDNIKKDGTFILKIKLPEKIDTPGDNVIFVGIKEKKGSEGMISAVASIRTPIVIKVPYPGIYPQISFSAPDMNINETRFFILNIKNLGKKDIKNARAEIDIISSSKEKIQTLKTENSEILSKGERELKVLFDPSSYKAGTYNAVARVMLDGGTKEYSDEFRIGELEIKIINYTNSFIQNKISKFDLLIRSGWNDEIKDINAEIKLFNKTKLLSEFKTVSVDLKPWSEKIISSYWDLGEISEGKYSLEIKLNYQGKEKIKEGEIEITGNNSFHLGSLISPSGIIIILMALVIIALIIHNIKTKTIQQKKTRVNAKPKKAQPSKTSKSAKSKKQLNKAKKNKK